MRDKPRLPSKVRKAVRMRMKNYNENYTTALRAIRAQEPAWIPVKGPIVVSGRLATPEVSAAMESAWDRVWDDKAKAGG